MLDRTPLLPLFLAALAVAGAVVVWPQDDGGVEGAERADGAPGFLSPPDEPPLAARAAPPRRADGRTAVSPGAKAFRARVDGIVERWIDEARRASGGRASGSNVTVAVHVVEPDGALLCARDADRPLRPASNMKLVTSAAALVLLGADWTFETRFEAAGIVSRGVLEGDLVVRAAGDPLYRADAAGRVEERLDEVVRDLAGRGLRRVRGDLVLDEGTFPAPGPGPEWPPENQYWQSSCALAGGFTVNGGILHAVVRAGAVGGRASIEVHPSPHGLRSRYGVETVARTVNDVRVGANAAGVTVAGEIGRAVGTVEATFAHPDPVELFGAVLRDRLERGGIAVGGEVRRERGARGGHLLAALRSPLRGALAPILRDSVNSVADQVFLATALAVEGRADREAGRAATARALARLGVDDEGLVQVDGSGLSRAGRVTARQLTELLAGATAAGGEGSALFRAALAVAGESGTLEARMRETAAKGRVRAKTGWIRGASSLSGFALGLDGRERLFSILVSYPADVSGLNRDCFKPMQDEIALALVEFGA